MRQTPLSLGYKMPAEWERHDATWLSWPKDPNTFPNDIIHDVESIYLEMIEALRAGERVDLLVDDLETEHRVTSLLKGTKNVAFHRIKTADVWVRDYGPIFVRKDSKEIAATKWIFNAWGGKYDDLIPDNENGKMIAKTTGSKLFETGIVLEGGSIDVNGLGSCLTTRQCLLNRNRNPSLNQNDISRFLKEYLGATNLIWLDSGIEGDDTDGHVDDIARFVNENSVVCMVEEDPQDANYLALSKNYDLLCDARDQEGRKLKISQIKMPKKLDSDDGRLPASYANFYVGNSAVLVPTFGCPNDEDALRILRGFFPDRKVTGIRCEALVYGFGGIHCVTQQQPSVLLTT